MGLLGNLKHAVRKSVDEAVDSRKADFAGTSVGKAVYGAKNAMASVKGGSAAPSAVMPWKRDENHMAVVMSPDVDGAFYTYYPEHLRGLKVGDRFLLEAVPGDVTLTSTYNGSKLNTHESRMIAYMYDGRIVGASTCCYRLTREAVERGYRVFCRAEKVGVYDRDVPEVRIWSTFRSEAPFEPSR